MVHNIIQVGNLIMKKIVSLILIFCCSITLWACANSENESKSENESSNVTTVQSTEKSGISLPVKISQSGEKTYITITGELVDYYIDKAKKEEISICLQVNGEDDNFGNLSIYTQPDGTTTARYYDFVVSEQIGIEYALTDGDATFIYDTDMINLDKVTDFCAYIDEFEDELLRQEYFSIEEVEFVKEVITEPVFEDEYGINGVYISTYCDDCEVAIITTDEEGYIATLDGVEYKLRDNEYDSGTDYIPFLGTNATGEEIRIDAGVDHNTNKYVFHFDKQDGSLSNTFYHINMFNEEYYSYDKDANKIESTIEFEFSGSNVKFIFFDTYTSDWIDVNDLELSETNIFTEDIPLTGMDGEIYFADLYSYESSYFANTSPISFTIYNSGISQSLENEGEIAPNGVVNSDTVISSDVTERDLMYDALGEFESATLNIYMEITENQIILNGNVIANINIDHWFAQVISNSRIVTYEGDTSDNILDMKLPDVDNPYYMVSMYAYGTFDSPTGVEPTPNQILLAGQIYGAK